VPYCISGWWASVGQYLMGQPLFLITVCSVSTLSGPALQDGCGWECSCSSEQLLSADAWWSWSRVPWIKHA